MKCAAETQEVTVSDMSNDQLKDELRFILGEPDLEEGELIQYDGVRCARCSCCSLKTCQGCVAHGKLTSQGHLYIRNKIIETVIPSRLDVPDAGWHIHTRTARILKPVLKGRVQLSQCGYF